jgi:hypothetical protein
MKNQINTQKDFGPLEDIKSYIHDASFPNKAVISIGATRYTPYGETTFLRRGDEVLIVVYNHTKQTLDDVVATLQKRVYENEHMSILAQEVN